MGGRVFGCCEQGHARHTDGPADTDQAETFAGACSKPTGTKKSSRKPFSPHVAAARLAPFASNQQRASQLPARCFFRFSGCLVFCFL